MQRALRILAAVLPVTLADCSNGCAADASDVGSLIQTQAAKADAGESGRTTQEKQNSTGRHEKVVSIQRDAIVQSHARSGDCTGIIDAMGRGINLGNVFDFNQGDRNPEVVKPHIKWAKDTGFQHVRIPVTWDGHFDANSLLTKQVTEVVDYALGLDLYVVINTHHEHWLKDHYDGSQHFNDQFWGLWQGIAGHFADKSKKLTFEILNEPDKAFGSWGENPQPFDQVAVDRTREINGVGYGSVRAVPGNEDRMIFLHSNAMSSIGTAKTIYPTKWNLPGGGNDACVGVTVHTYDPYDFCGENGHSDYYASVEALKKDLLFRFKDLRDWAFDSHIPLYVGEYGVGRQMDRQWDRDNDKVREYYRFVGGHFRECGFAVAAWDDPGWFGIYNQQHMNHHTQIVTPY